MAQNDVVVLTGDILAAHKGAPQRRASPEDREQLRGNHRASQTHGLALSRQVELVPFRVSRHIHRVHLLTHGHKGTSGISPSHTCELFGFGVGE